MAAITRPIEKMTVGKIESQSVSRKFASDENWRCEYPFDSHFFEIAGNRLHYIDEHPTGHSGSDDAAGPVLMVHGNPTWSFYYRRLIASVGQSRRVIAVDNLGCGLSDKPEDFDYCLESHVENLCKLIDSLGLSNVTLMAHDWGGAIGMGVLLARRERFKQIILFNTAAFPPAFIPFRIRVCRWPLIGKLAVQGLNLFARAATFMATEQKGGLPLPVADGLLAPYDNWANRTAIYHFVKDIPLARSHRTWGVLETIENKLSTVADWPILLVWGMKDWCFRPECLRRMQQHWPNAESHELANAGHYVIEDEPEEVDAIVQSFLNRHES